MPAPHRVGYLICFVPRSGSTWLCQLLQSTGVLGRPREWFHPRQLQAASEELDTLKDYLEHLSDAATTRNGVWGCKVTWSHIQPLICRGELPHEVLGFPLLYIWLDRDDRAAQAISDYAAMFTGRFHSTMSVGTAADFNLARIREVESALDCGRRSFLAWFSAAGLPYLQMTYEQLESDPLGALQSIARHLHVDLPESPITSAVEKLTDFETHVVWPEAYRRALAHG